MKKNFALLFVAFFGTIATYAGTYVIGVNQVDRFLNSIEQGTGDVPPTTPKQSNGTTIQADYDDGNWATFEGLTYTDEVIDHSLLPWYCLKDDGTDQGDDYDWYGIVGINYANKGYAQKADSVIKFIQPSLVKSEYVSVPAGYSTVKNYCEKNDFSWLESINLSGNDFRSIEIDGGLYNNMPLKSVNLSNNSNLTSVSIINCTQLDTVDLRNTGISTTDIQTVKDGIWESSPDAIVLYSIASGVNLVRNDVPVVIVKEKNIIIKNKNANDIVNIFDLSGHKLIETSDDVINLSPVNKGLYIVKINNYTQKISI